MIIEAQNLTPAARAALVRTGYQPGTPLHPSATLRVAAELAWYDLISTDATLTRDGAYVCARCIDSTMRELES